MVTTNIKKYNDEDIIELINGIQNGDIGYNMDDLKTLLAEVTNRKLDTTVTDVVVGLINCEITGDTNKGTSGKGDNTKSSKRPVDQKSSKENYKKKSFEEFHNNEQEKYPILSFISGLFKVIAWLFLVGAIVASSIFAYAYVKDDNLLIIASIFGGIVIGTFLLIFFYAQAEKIQIQLDIERHLRN